jgi:hypothetical protein
VTKGAVLIDEESWGDINHWGKIYKEGLTHIIES